MTTQVTFHFNVADRMTHASRVMRKAVGQGHCVTCVSRPSDVNALDERLWTLAPLAFLPHATDASAPHVLARSPILLTSQWPERGDVLLNLTNDVPDRCDQFARVVEVVSTDDQDRAAARQRWKRYLAMGLKPVGHDFSAAGD